MKKTSFLKTTIIASTLSILSLGIVASLGAEAKNQVNATVGNFTVPAETYYDGITAKSGVELTGQVHDLIVKTHKIYTTYDDNGKNGYQKYSDANPDNPNEIIEWYSGMPMSNVWNPVTGGYNREHVWCQSLSNGLWGEKGGGSDMHHLRPVEVTLNTARNNSPYGVIENRENYKKYPKNSSKQEITEWCGGYKTGDVFEPLDNKKGDVARVLMYTYLHYSKFENVGGTTNGSGSKDFFGNLKITSVVSATTEKAAWDLLLEWNKSDPVDILETNRNEVVANFQGNRNPFIDHPEYADAMWGETPLPGGEETSEQPSSMESSEEVTSVADSSSSSSQSSEPSKKGKGCGGSIESSLGIIAFSVVGLSILGVTFAITRSRKR